MQIIFILWQNKLQASTTQPTCKEGSNIINQKIQGREVLLIEENIKPANHANRFEN